jgi:N-acyl homoserine lactone hydrolase
VHKSSRRLTEAGDVVAVATPGHTADHISVVVQDGGTAYFLAGDTSYNEQLMLAGKLDGVSADEQVSRATLDAIYPLASDRVSADARSAVRRPSGGRAVCRGR